MKTLRKQYKKKDTAREGRNFRIHHLPFLFHKSKINDFDLPLIIKIKRI
jgi:hypothetical protein